MQSDPQNSDEEPSIDTMLNMMHCAGGILKWELEEARWNISVTLPNTDVLQYRGKEGQPLEQLVALAFDAYLNGVWDARVTTARYRYGWIEPNAIFGWKGA